MADLIDYTLDMNSETYHDRHRTRNQVTRSRASHINAAPRPNTELVEPPAWMSAGHCGGDNANLFAAAFDTRSSTIKSEAKKVCASCPVRETCLEFELEHEAPLPGGADVLPAAYRFGLFGGRTPQERFQIATERHAS